MKYKILKTKYGELNAKHRDAFSPCLLLSTSNQLISCLGHKNFRLSTNSRGVATLPTVMLLGVMALIVAVSVTTLSFSELMISQGSSQSSRAYFYAESGARDALIKIARNKNFSYIIGSGYPIEFASGGCSLPSECAQVTVSTGTGATGDPKIITSKGTLKSSTRTVQVSVILDGGTVSNGQITSATWSEVTN